LANLLDLAGITPQLRGVYLYVPRLPALDAQFRAQLRQRAQRNSDFKFTLQVQRPNFHFEKQHRDRAQTL
jgi:hypothetical protein